MKKITTITLLCLLSLTSNATDFSSEILAGYSTLDINGSSGNINSDSGFTTGINGIWAFNDYLAFDAEFLDYMTYDRQYEEFNSVAYDGMLSSYSFSFGVRASIPLNEEFVLFGRLGYVRLDIEETGLATLNPDTTLSYRERKRGEDNYYALGLNYHLKDKLSLGFEYYAADIQVEEQFGTTEQYELSNYFVFLEYDF